MSAPSKLLRLSLPFASLGGTLRYLNLGGRGGDLVTLVGSRDFVVLFWVVCALSLPIECSLCLSETRTPEFTFGSWVGNREQTSMEKRQRWSQHTQPQEANCGNYWPWTWVVCKLPSLPSSVVASQIEGHVCTSQKPPCSRVFHATVDLQESWCLPTFVEQRSGSNTLCGNLILIELLSPGLIIF